MRLSAWYASLTSALLDSEAALVVVNHDRNTAVGSQVCEPLLFLDILHDRDVLEGIMRLAVSFLKLLEDDGSFVACTLLAHRSVQISLSLPYR